MGAIAPESSWAQVRSLFGGGTEEPKITWQMQPDRESVRPGEELRLHWQADLAPGWRMYAMDSPEGAGIPLSVMLDELPSDWTQEGSFHQSETIQKYDRFFDKEVRYFEEAAHIATIVRLRESAAAGVDSLKASVRFQICDDEMCLPPTTRTFSTPVTVSEGEARGAYLELPVEGGDGELAASSTNRSRAEASGLWSFLFLAVGAGFAALLTPCVFPMIPLTVSFFTRHAGNRGRATRMALVYGFAIVGTFTALGIVTALLVGAAGAQTIAANPWINLGIGLIFLIFALALLGLFELRLPSGFVNYFSRRGNQEPGYLGVLFMGLTLTLVSFSCTAPFIGGLLAAAAQNQWAYPVIGMVGFSTAFSLPFVVFALFPNTLESLPSSGSWMNAVKVVLGFVELAAAFKFISNADLVWNWGFFSRSLVLAIWIVIFALAGVYLLGKLPLAGDKRTSQIGTLRLMAAIGFLSFSLYLMPGLLGAPLQKVDAFLPPRTTTDGGLTTTLAGYEENDRALSLNWHEEIDDARRQARETSQPIFIDFTGYTCTNCREMESIVFPQPSIVRRLEHDFVLLRLYTDDASDGARWQQYQLDLTGTVALPTYAVITPDEKVLRQWEGMASVEEFEGVLQAGIEGFEQQQSLAAGNSRAGNGATGVRGDRSGSPR
jgi:thiol:disulfide interchange protein DsbD